MSTTDTVKALRRQGRQANAGFNQRGGFHGHQGQAKTRSDRRSGKQNGWT